MKELRREVEKLKQVGVMGTTLGVQLERLRETGHAFMDAFPFVEFGPGLRTHAVPTVPADKYEIIRVRVEEQATFPAPPYTEFRMPTIQQTIFLIRGQMTVTVDGETFNLLPCDSLKITQGAWIRFVYHHADAIFRQVPRIAGEADMQLR